MANGTSNPSEVVLSMENIDHLHPSTKPPLNRPELTLKDTSITDSDQIHDSKPTNQSSSAPPTPTGIIRRRRTLRQFSLSNPKARTVEFIHPQPQPQPRAFNPTTTQNIEEEEDYPSNYYDKESSSDSESELSDSEEEYDNYGNKGHNGIRKKKKKVNWKVITEWIMFITILTCLICSLTIKSFKYKQKWGLEYWRWCLMVMVVFSGRLVSGWVMGLLVFIVERNFLLKEKVLYFVYGLRRSFQNCVWLGLVLMAWAFMFNTSVHKKNRMLRKTFQGLVAVLVAATIWLLKIVLVKTCASSFHVRTYFDRMKESVFHHYILETLSGPPADEILREEENPHLKGSKSLPKNWKEARNHYKSKKFGSRKIDMEQLRQLSMQKRPSAWTVKRLIKYIRSSGLSSISQTVDQFGNSEAEITSEWEARNTAKRIFKNVAKSGAKYIEEEDLARFLKRVEIHTIFPLFEGALETGTISKSSFRNWVVRAYMERKSLAHSLNDTKTAVQQLHKLASAIVSVIIVVVTLLVMGFATINVITLILTQIFLLGFIFQNMCKTVFESIVFVFVMHPFDIGDRCVIDGVQMIVEEMNILTTVFLRYDMEKIYYPNAVLLTKPISNFYRSPEMGDAIQFSINASTPVETISAFKKAIQSYIESKPKFWSPKHSVIVKEIQDPNRMKMMLGVQHTINHQNYGERSTRISELILEMKRIFESLGIKYTLLPQEIHLTQFKINGSVAATVPA